MLAKPFLNNIPFLLVYISLVSSSPTTATGHNGLISRTSHGTRFGHVAAASKKTNSGAHHAAVLLRAHTAELHYLSKRDTVDPIDMIPQIPGSGKSNSSPTIPIQIDGLVQIPGQSGDSTVKERVSTPNMNTADAVVQGASADAKSITASVPKPSYVTDQVPSGPPSAAEAAVPTTLPQAGGVSTRIG
ncbi:hypothetical protein CPC08DRAFT_752814 [Agrocybe pediades]|nr:hypothetical protein CPC08DRAFT_752814 [Agrocybe pediades]